MMIINNRRGVSLIETVIALGLLVAVMAASASLLIGSIKAPQKSQKYIIAQGYLNEAVAGLKAVSQVNWQSLILGRGQIRTQDDTWSFIGTAESQELDNYSRVITIDPVYRSDMEIVEASEPGAVEDVFSKIANISIRWTDNGLSHSIGNEVLISPWKARSFEQSDWSGGGGFDIYGNDNVYWSASNTIATANSISLSSSGTSTYEIEGELISSAIRLSDLDEYIAVSREETIPQICSLCAIKIQLKTAFDVYGSPGTWSSTWNGPEGEDADEDDYFTNNLGELILDSSGREWIKYRVLMTSDGSFTPIMDSIKFYYQ